MKRWILLIFLALASLCQAQTNYTWPIDVSTTAFATPTMGARNVGFTSITATQIYADGPNLLPAGTAYWQAVDSAGNPISYQINGAGQSIRTPTVCSVVDGAIVQPCSVADTNLTNPIHTCFSLTIRDTNNNLVLGGPGQGYSCVQPYGATWSLDAYSPFVAGVPLMTTPVAQVGLRGVLQAPNCLSGGQFLAPLDINSDGSWNCFYFGNREIHTFNDQNPSPADSGVLHYKYPYDVSIQRISCSSTGGTTQINFDVRNENSTDVAGPQVLTLPLTCPSGSTSSATTFAIPTIGANHPVVLNIISSGATSVQVHLETKQ